MSNVKKCRTLLHPPTPPRMDQWIKEKKKRNRAKIKQPRYSSHTWVQQLVTGHFCTENMAEFVQSLTSVLKYPETGNTPIPTRLYTLYSYVPTVPAATAILSMELMNCMYIIDKAPNRS